jgi:hypothetical protein
MSEEVMGRLLPESIGPSAEVEKAALREMRRAFRERTVAAVVAVFGAAMALVCLPESAATLIETLRKGGVWVAAGFCVISLFSAWIFLKHCAKLQALGLPRARGLRAYWAWQLAGAVINFAVVATVFASLGWTLRHIGLSMLPGLLIAAWLGRRLHQIPDAEQARADQWRTKSILQGEDDRTGG